MFIVNKSNAKRKEGDEKERRESRSLLMLKTCVTIENKETNINSK